MSAKSGLSEAIAEIAMALGKPLALGEAFGVVTSAAQRYLVDVDFASITIHTPQDGWETHGSTDQVLTDCDRMQFDLREGPCVDVVRNGGLVVANDLARDDRWPVYGPKVAGLGVAAQLSIELPCSQQWQAALNLGARVTEAFGPEAVAHAESLASHAALAVNLSRKLATAEAALQSRGVIGQAIGIVMHRYQLNDDRAFAFLVRVSQNRNVKLRTVAQEIVEELNQTHRADPTLVQ